MSLSSVYACEQTSIRSLQLTLIEPGRFRTSATTKGVGVPAHPAYTAPTNPAAKIRQSFAAAGDPNNKIGDPRKAARVVYELAGHSSPPLRVVLGHDSIALARSQLELVNKDVDQSAEVWSKDLQED